MTFKEYLGRINKLLQKDVASKPFGLAVTTVHADMSERIFIDKKNTNNIIIGKYNKTKPLYVNPNLSPGTKFDPIGKTGKSKFANGENHKTGYFKSYYKYRVAIGRPNEEVNLNLSGQLKSDFENGVVKNGNFEYVLIVSDDSKDKIDGNEKHFKKGEIFQMTKKEKEDFDKYFEDAINEALQ